VEGIAAEDGCAVEAVVFLRVDVKILLEVLVLLRVGEMNFLRVEIEDGVDFDELDGVGVIHVEGGSEVGGDVGVVSALHSEVGFVEDEEVDVFDLVELS
jgi:hypothetical protein